MLRAAAIRTPGIEREGASCVHDKGVDFELADLRVIGGDLAEADQQLLHRLDVRSMFAAIPLEQFAHRRARYQPARQQRVQRWKLE